MNKLIICMLLIPAVATPAAADVAALCRSLEEVETVSLRLEAPAPELSGGATAALIASGDWQQDPAASHGYSPVKEGARSFLLPGLGQYHMERKTRAAVYLSLEAVNWIFIATSLWQGQAREDAYQEYAIAYAGVTGTGHSDDYYELIGSYYSNDGPGGYNESLKREARDLYYPDVDAMNAYYEAHEISGSSSWRWRSPTAFENYNELYDGSRFANRRALYGLMFALALRAVSTVDAVWLAKRTAAAPSEPLSIGVEPMPRGFLLTLNTSF